MADFMRDGVVSKGMFHSFMPANLGSGICYLCGLSKDEAIHENPLQKARDYEEGKGFPVSVEDVERLRAELHRLRAYADGETDKLRDTLRKLDEQDDLVKLMQAALEKIAQWPWPAHLGGVQTAKDTAADALERTSTDIGSPFPEGW